MPDDIKLLCKTLRRIARLFQIEAHNDYMWTVISAIRGAALTIEAGAGAGDVHDVDLITSQFERVNDAIKYYSEATGENLRERMIEAGRAAVYYKED